MRLELHRAPLAPAVPVAPGGVATAQLAFEGVTDPSAFTMSVEPGFGFDHDAAFWSTTAV